MTTPSSTTTAPARFLLLGDSHAGPVARAATAARLPFVGGPVGSGRDFTVGFFDVHDDDVVFRDAAVQELHRGFLTTAGVSALGRLTVPLVSTFGLSVHFYATTANWQGVRISAARRRGLAVGTPSRIRGPPAWSGGPQQAGVTAAGHPDVSGASSCRCGRKTARSAPRPSSCGNCAAYLDAPTRCCISQG
ncbi:hypothetical protein [Micromonospora matsumotoense]|uniref:hypothetical protein n=1 Tax=Micromonospora matsumotoense TaxID=121616 RepID=UPI000A87BBBD|nr:hypothetical protein [Micromonospora matsumotoense]